MITRVRLILTLALVAPVQLPAQSSGSPASAQGGGDESQLLARTVGTWDVITTFRFAPDSAPVVTRGVVAERRMVGAYLEEVMRPGPGSELADFRRISYLTYGKTEGRWQYVSLDTRLPVGIMPAFSFGKETDRKLTLQFEPMGFAGFDGRMMRSNLVITRVSEGRELAQQYWIAADGTGREWLAVQYEYIRRR
jgi:Protein of unknown function (DUF1579)